MVRRDLRVVDVEAKVVQCAGDALQQTDANRGVRLPLEKDARRLGSADCFPIE
jgi:hypothetical protein